MTPDRLSVLVVSLLICLPVLQSLAEPLANNPPGTKFTVTDAEAFGYRVALSGNLALIDARNTGRVYLFNTTTGQQITKFTPADPDVDDGFGSAFAINEQFILIGAPSDSELVANGGAAYLYDVTNLELIRKLQPSTPNGSNTPDPRFNGLFGTSVALSGNLALVGARFADARSPGDRSGAAYVFDCSTGQQVTKLTADDGSTDDSFGGAVALHGTLALVGADRDDDGAENSGSAYLFDALTGEQLAKFTAEEPTEQHWFGRQLALSESFAIIGDANDDESGRNSGAAYLFSNTTGNQVAKLKLDNAAADDNFGSSVSASEGLLLIGASSKTTVRRFEGAAFVFDLDTLRLLASLEAADGNSFDSFGLSVALSSRTALVGAYLNDDDEDEEGSGSAYLFDIPIYRPDCLIGRAPFLGAGNNRYNSSTSGQRLVLTSRKLRRLKAWLTVQNDGDTIDDIALAASRGSRDFSVKYFGRISNRRVNITGAITGSNYTEFDVEPSDPGRPIQTAIKPGKRLKRKKRTRQGSQRTTILKRGRTLRLSATSCAVDFRRDSAAVSARTR